MTGTKDKVNKISYEVDDFVLVTFVDKYGMYTSEFGHIIQKNTDENFVVELVDHRGFVFSTPKDLEIAGKA